MATKEELPGTIMSNKAEMVPDVQQIKNTYFNVKMTFIVCYIAIQTFISILKIINKEEV